MSIDFHFWSFLREPFRPNDTPPVFLDDDNDDDRKPYDDGEDD